MSGIEDKSVASKTSFSDAQVAQELEKKATEGLLGRHITWLKKPRGTAAKVGIIALIILESALLTVTGVGIPILFKAKRVCNELTIYDKLKTRTEKIDPPSNEPINIKTATRTFNHTHDFAIHNERVWCRVRGEKTPAEWQLMYFNEKGENNPPVELRADGCNLMVKDKSNIVHYKKVLEESRSRATGKYKSKDLTAKSNWERSWFNLPVAEWIYHIFAPRELKIPDDAKWAMSHRGDFNYYFNDAKGRRHSEFAMVTTVYVLPKEGTHILFADPFLPNKLGNKLQGPENFIAENIAASASTLFVIGKDKESGKPKMYTKLADFDTLGRNPILPGFYASGMAGSKDWTEQNLPALKGNASIDPDSITIYQTGEGNDARTLHIQGTNDIGENGYYSKGITEEEWVFHKT